MGDEAGRTAKPRAESSARTRLDGLLDRLYGPDAFLVDRPIARTAVIMAGTLVAILLVANVIAQILVGGTGSSANSASAIAQLDRVQPGSVLKDDNTEPKQLADPVGMGSRHAGLALVARSEVEKVNTSGGPRRAPEGSTLIAFQLGNWDCEEPPCQDWETLKPQVVLDGSIEDLPTGADTFVVVVPPGTDSVELAIDADGFSQSLSLRDDSAGDRNIALLQSADREKPTTINQSFRLAERTSMPLQDANGQVADTFYRNVVLTDVQRRFFFKGATPSGPRRAFLVVNTSYSYVGQTNPYVPLDEVAFVDAKGRRYAGRDLDPSDSVALLGFEIPANVTKGTLTYGGSFPRVSTTGASYTATVDAKNVSITFR